jgi:hypothetical protein
MSEVSFFSTPKEERMATIRKSCYSYTLQSNTSPNTPGGNADINCYDNHGAIIGILHFDENGFGNGSGGRLNQNQQIEMFFQFRSLESVINILRTKKPLTLVIDPDQNNLGYVISQKLR